MLQEQGCSLASLPCYHAALALLPSSLPAFSSLALALASLGKVREQLEVLKAAEGVLRAGEQEEDLLCVLLDCCLPCPPSLSLAKVLQEQGRILAGSSRKSEAADR